MNCIAEITRKTITIVDIIILQPIATLLDIQMSLMKKYWQILQVYLDGVFN